MEILITDDDPDIQESLKYVLESEGYTVSLAANSHDLYSLIEKKVPDLILLDYMLPGEQGGEIAMKLKKNKETKNIPIIMISANHNIEKEVKRIGLRYFLPKPFDLQDLLKLTKKVLNN